MTRRSGGHPNVIDEDQLDPRVTLAIRGAMSDLVSDTSLSGELVAGARHRARRITVHRRLAAVGVVAVLVAGAGAGVRDFSTRAPHGRVATAGLLPDWPSRGGDAKDASGIARAMAAWDAATHQGHTLKAVLYAGRDSVGSAAIVLATDTSGHLRLGGLTGQNPGAFTPTKLVVDRPVLTRPAAVFLLHNEVGRNPVLIAVTNSRFDTMSWTQTTALPDRPPHDSVVGGVDIIDFFDPAYVPKTVVLSGPGVADVTVPVQ